MFNNHNESLRIEYLAKRYNEVNIPLYLSYPTSNWWDNPIDDNSFIKRHRDYSPTFLYFHFPYCEKACYYCMCYKHVAPDSTYNDVYIKYLEKEFLNRLDLLERAYLDRVRHIHWGGGTPSYLTCRQIEKIHRSIFDKVKIVDMENASISIEAYPDERILTDEKLILLRNLGFNEISFGIQDFDSRIQKIINRNCTYQSVSNLIRKSKELGLRVHIDLCYGLPFQGLNELEKTIDAVIRMSPHRVALFTYAHYPAIFPLQRKIPSSSIPNSFLRVMLAMHAEELLKSHGYHKVGYDHFVKEDDPLFKACCNRQIQRDLMGYSVNQKREFMGFGCSAISYMKHGFYQNIHSLKKYYRTIDEDKIPLERNISHLLSEEDRLRNKIIQKNILGDFWVSKNEIDCEFGISFEDHFNYELDALARFEKDGLVDLSDSDAIQVTRKGEYFVRHIAHVFDSYYNRREALN